MTVALVEESLPWGGITGKGQSERWKPDPRRSVHAPKVATNRQAEAHDLLGQSDSPAPASEIAEA